MRLSIASALFISLFGGTAASSATAQTAAAYTPGSNDLVIVSFSAKPITRQDIERFEKSRSICDKARHDAGLPYADPGARYFMQICMDSAPVAALPKPAPKKWHEGVSQAAGLCGRYASKQAKLLPTASPPAYGAYTVATSFTTCLGIELSAEQ